MLSGFRQSPGRAGYGTLARGPVCAFKRDDERSCTDLCALIVFIVFWAAMICLAIYAFSWGDPSRLLYGVDYEGNLCGIDGRGKNQYYFETQMASSNTNPYGLLQAVCVTDCPEVGAVIREGVSCAAGCAVTIPTQSELYVCLPTNESSSGDLSGYSGYGEVVTYMSGWDQRYKRYIHDVEQSSQEFVLLGCFVTPALSYFYIRLLQIEHVASSMIYMSIFLLQVAMIMLIVFTAIEADYIADRVIIDWQNQYSYNIDHDYPKLFAAAFWFLLVLEAAVLCMLFALWSRIELAVKILRQACNAVSHIWFLTMFPFIPALMYICLLAYFVITASYIFTCETSVSSKDPTSMLASLGLSRSTTVTMQPDTRMSEGWIWFHLLGFLWTSCVIEAITICTVAGATCEWYWTAEKKRVGGVQPVWDAFWRCCRFHLGSLAFGSLFIAVVEFFRLVLSYVDRQTRLPRRWNGCIRLLACSCACCMWCLRKFVRYVNKNSYIMIAMKGKTLCPSMYEAFELIFANLLKVATAGIASAFVLFIGKLAIVGAIASLGFWFVVDANELSEPFWPMFTLCLIAYYVCCFFLHVYDIAVDTILLCICEDEKINVPGNYFATTWKEKGVLQANLDRWAEPHALESFKQQAQQARNGPVIYERAHDETQSDGVENPMQREWHAGEHRNPTASR
jgi:choline transporter-like protein 2/4/5